MPQVQFLIDNDRQGDERRVLERFAEDLRGCGAVVSILTEPRSADLSDAFVIVAEETPPPWILELPSSEQQRYLARLFLIGCRRAPGMLEDLEAHGVAGGIEALTVWLWSTGRHVGGYGIAGRRAIVERLGGACAGGSFTSESYCLYDSPAARTLPQALFAYLDALEASR